MRIAILHIAFIFVSVQMAFAKTIEVCENCQISSIKEAIELAETGDTIHVASGVYHEGNINISKSIKLIGEGYPVIDGLNSTEIITITAPGVLIDGFQIQNVGKDFLEDRAGIRLVETKDFIIRNNKLLNTFFGIYVEHSRSGIIENNEIIGKAIHEMSSGNAIHAWYCKNILIKNNIAKNHRDGIYFEFVENSSVEGNLSQDNLRYGLHFMFSNNDSYSENKFINNGAGVAVMFSKNIDMSYNLFERNWGKSSYGVLLKEIYDATIEDNRFYKNTTGIYIEGSTRIKYQHNEFIQNGWAINISGGCLENEFTANNFISNTMDIVINSHVNDNTFDGNYWTDYSGYDLDKDGIGDVPHRPVKLFSYVLGKSRESIILLRSLFVDLINFSEKVSPVFTPENVLDNHPLMKPYK